MFGRKKYTDPFSPEGNFYHVRDQYPTDADKALLRRIAQYGTRGIIKIGSVEGGSVSFEAAKNLIPAGPEDTIAESIER